MNYKRVVLNSSSIYNSIIGGINRYSFELFKSISKNNRFKFSNGGAITVICYDMDKDFFDPNDQLYLAITSEKLVKWIRENTQPLVS